MWGSPLSEALHEVCHKRQGTEGQVTAGESHFAGTGTAWEGGKLHTINLMPNP